MDRFKTFDSFVRVATTASFSAAAKQLGMVARPTLAAKDLPMGALVEIDAVAVMPD